MIQVEKRNGELKEFDLHKIDAAIEKAFKATGKEYTSDIISLLSLRVTAQFQNKVNNGVIGVEDIQDSVEHVLEQTGYTDVAKAYILYRKQREKLREMKSTILAHPRSFHADRLLRRMVPEAADPGRSRRNPGQDHVLAGKAPLDAHEPDG